MSWLAPLFLAAGAAAIAIPVLVHLIHRERADTIAFPSLMFLQRIPYRTMRRQKIRHWLLFLLRSVALILLATAFARPFFERRNALASGASGARQVVILLDQSYSMAYGDHWQRGVAAARQAISGLGSGDRASVVLFSDEAHAVTQATNDRAALIQAIDTAKVSSRGTRYAPALKVARSILDVSRLPRREVVLITDFQRRGWNTDDNVRLPEGTVLTRVDLSGPAGPDVAIGDIAFQRDFPQGRERVLASARVINKGSEPRKNLPVSLELNGREIQSRTVDIAANSAASVGFSPFMLPEGTSRGAIHTPDDALPTDNDFYFALTPGQSVSVLVLEPAGGPDRSLYLRRAMAVGQRPAFRVEVRRVNQVAAADLEHRSVVILDDAGIPTPALARELEQYVSNGGGLVVATGERSGSGGFAAEARGILPSLPGTVIDRASAAGGKLTRIDYGHPVFELFSAPRSGDFSGTRFFRYRKLDVRDFGTTGGAGKAGATGPAAATAPAVLASFDDGNPALVEMRHGRGTVLLWASTLDNYWSDLAVQPVFLPFVHQILRRAAGYRESAPWFTVGQSVDIAGQAGGRTGGQDDERGELIAVAPSGARTVLPAGTGARVLNLSEQGFYEVRRPGETTPLRVVASNVDLDETDFAKIDPAELAAAVEPQGGPAAVDKTEQPRVAAEERERPQSLWWYLLLGAFVILAAETIVGNHLSRGAAT